MKRPINDDNFLRACDEALALLEAIPDQVLPLEIRSGPNAYQPDIWIRSVTWYLPAIPPYNNVGQAWSQEYHEEINNQMERVLDGIGRRL